jgi:hypothetical protein
MAKKDFFLFAQGKENRHTPIVRKDKVLMALKNGRSDDLAAAFVRYFDFFQTHQFLALARDDQKNIHDAVTMFFTVVTDDRFRPRDNAWHALIACGHIISNVVALTGYGTTDGPLQRAVLKSEHNLGAILTLLNSRCSQRISPEKFFDISPSIASLWQSTYIYGTSCPSLRQQQNLFRHIDEWDMRWQTVNRIVSSVYFTCTYLNPESDLRVKSCINKAIKEKCRIQVRNNPDPKRIAIITAKWHRNHAVYKSASPLVDQLKGHYSLDLYHIGEKKPSNLVTEGFDHVGQIYFNEDIANNKLEMPRQLEDNDYQMIYYPDIGMNDESVWLSNARLAPIQAVGYGHPASTGADNEIDYFIGGDIEKDATDCYAETMVLIPGLAQEPAWPTYERKFNWEKNEKVRIHCAWGPDKYNYSMLVLLAHASKMAADTPHEFHFFPSPGINRYAGFMPFQKEVQAVLPNAIIHPDKEYYDYMEELEKGDFTINSFPFGGYNTVVESFFLGLPMVALEGGRFYNRAASYLLRKLGMAQLTSGVPNEFAAIVANLIRDEHLRTHYRDLLANMDLKKALFAKKPDYFKQAVDYIIANHPFKETVLINEQANG